MAICYLDCSHSVIQQIKDNCCNQQQQPVAVNFPISGSTLNIELLIIGPKIKDQQRLAAALSDWRIPPVALFILPTTTSELQVDRLTHHPRTGRSMFFCQDTESSILAGLAEILRFHRQRHALQLDQEVSGDFCINNISPRWLFQTMMEHLDEYIYFKDSNTRFLAVSRYFVECVGKSNPSQVIGLQDFDLFDQKHAQDAYQDEIKIALGQVAGISKEELLIKDGQDTWVSSRKFPLYTPSNYIAGSFGLSRDITKEKALNTALESNHQRMQAELLLARNLQTTLMQQQLPLMQKDDGSSALQLASKYIPSFHLSGDFYSVAQTECGGVAFFIADVMGHGVRAAMVTAMIQVAVQQLRSLGSQPAQFMQKLNQMMFRSIQPSGQLLFTTGAYCHLDLKTQLFTYVQAGARHGIYVPVDPCKASAAFDNNNVGPALGLLQDTKYCETTIQMEAADEIILYTDGIVEAALGEEEFSEKRLMNFLAKHRRGNLPEMLDTLLQSVQQFTGADELEDDVCLVALRLK
jgi:phosphoserine phosphatase RsbU/P